MNGKYLPEPLPRIKAFEDMGFGMFVHWGLYSQLGKGEWVQFLHNMEIAEYRKLMNTFTAEDFDPEDWARTARNAGMKYIVLTTRHHDGFSLYDTCGLNSFDALHSAANRDLVAEYVAACSKYDIVPFFYHTTLDWQWEGKKTRDLTEVEFGRYLDYLCRSVEILCKNYGKIGGFWFDGNWIRPDSDWQEGRLYATIRKYQPETIIINNTGLFQLGKLGHEEIDSVTFENNHAKPMDRRGHKKYVAAEVCKTMNSNWGIGNDDLNFLSPPDVIKRLASARGCGANLLLNIGPEAQGKIPEYERVVLKLVGKWHEYFKEALHSPRPAPECRCQEEDFMLKEGRNYYYFVFNLAVAGDENVTQGCSIGTRSIDGFMHKVSSVRWLDNGEELAYLQNREKEMLAIHCTGFTYGTDFVVRVARIETTE